MWKKKNWKDVCLVLWNHVNVDLKMNVCVRVFKRIASKLLFLRSIYDFIVFLS